VDEGAGGGARVTFQRSGDLGPPLEVDYLLAGSAVPGVDYATLPGRITIPAGASSVAVEIVPLDDAELEGDETVEVRLGDSPVYNPVTASRAVVVLRDDEQPTVTVEALDDRAIEGDDPGTFLFRRAGLAAEAVVVRYRFAGSAVHQADFVASGDRIVIPAGQRQAVLTVTPIDDALREDAETIALELVADPAYAIGTPSRAAVTLEDNGDTTPAAGFALLASQAPESRTNPELAVRISGNPEEGELNAVTVFYELLGGSATLDQDYVLTNGTLVFPYGDPAADTPLTNRIAFVPLQVIDDLRLEPDETILVRLRIGPTIIPSEDTNQPPQVQTNGVTDVYAVHTFTILDDDRSVVTVAPAPGAAGTVEGSVDPARFVITRSGATNRAQTVEFHLSGLAAAGSDFVTVATRIDLAPGQTAAEVAVVPVDDPIMEYREDVVLTLMNAPGARIGAERQAAGDDRRQRRDHRVHGGALGSPRGGARSFHPRAPPGRHQPDRERRLHRVAGIGRTGFGRHQRGRDRRRFLPDPRRARLRSRRTAPRVPRPSPGRRSDRVDRDHRTPAGPRDRFVPARRPEHGHAFPARRRRTSDDRHERRRRRRNRGLRRGAPGAVRSDRPGLHRGVPDGGSLGRGRSRLRGGSKEP
jgi:ribosomal 50S subunit-recycling heat shock protein